MTTENTQKNTSPASRKKPALGRGLSALFNDAASEYAAASPAANNDTGSQGAATVGVKTMPVEFLHPGMGQPRRYFDTEAIDQLAESLRHQGMLQPILVRRSAKNDGQYEIIAGERRWRAAQKAQLSDVPVVVQDLSDEACLEIGLIENLQREDLTPIEEAAGYRRLIDEFSYTQDQLAKRIGKSRSHVANLLRLLTLPDAVQVMVNRQELSMGHARALITAAEPEKLARAIIDKGLSVRQAEKLASAGLTATQSQKVGPSAKKTKEKDIDTLALEADLTARLGLKVAIDVKGVGGENGGRVTIEYGDLDQLDDLLAKLTG